MTVSLQFKPPVIAHRGASGYAPENTIAAFTLAAQMDIQWLEFDVAQAADGEPIIFHDEMLDRTTNGRGLPSQLPYAILRTLDAGAWYAPRFAGEQIPSLRQVIEFLENTTLCANVEIKARPQHEEALIKRVFAELAQSSLGIVTPRLLFSSFSLPALKLLRQYSPDCNIGVLLHEWQPNWQMLCSSLQCVSVNVNEAIMSREAAHTIKNMGKLLLCYTVNDPLRAKELYSWGVDAVFSDVPDQIVKYASVFS